MPMAVGDLELGKTCLHRKIFHAFTLVVILLILFQIFIVFGRLFFAGIVFSWSRCVFLLLLLFVMVTGSRCRLFLPMRYFECVLSGLFDTNTHAQTNAHQHTDIRVHMWACVCCVSLRPFILSSPISSSEKESQQASVWSARAKKNERKRRRVTMMYAYRNRTYT